MSVFNRQDHPEYSGDSPTGERKDVSMSCRRHLCSCLLKLHIQVQRSLRDDINISLRFCD